MLSFFRPPVNTTVFFLTSHVNISTGVSVHVTVNESTLLSNASTYIRISGMHNIPTTGCFLKFLLNLFNEFVTRLSNYCRGIFFRPDMMNSANFASNWRGRLVRGSFTFPHSLCICCDASRV